jgi:catechol 2,3-dioxygenase-like lactoylglutathione lyase family enzyme
MTTRLDHVVLWVEDPLRSVEFFERVVGLRGVRATEYQEDAAPFPSVRVSDDTILDLMPRSAAPAVDAVTGAVGAAGHLINHICLAMSEKEFEGLRTRLTAHGTPPSHEMERSFGARGLAPRAFYFRDPDGNVFEARYYQ